MNTLESALVLPLIIKNKFTHSHLISSLSSAFHLPRQPRSLLQSKPSMANQNDSSTIIIQEQSDNNLPIVFHYGPPGLSSILKSHASHNFRILNPSSPLPIHQFLSTHPHHAPSIAAVVCSGVLPLTADVLQLLPNLRLLVTSSAGTNHIDLEECHRRGIQVAGAGNLFSEDVADMAVGLLIDVTRKISAADRCLRTGLRSAFLDFPLASKPTGKKVGIVGLGRIGLEVAKRLEAFDCIVSYNSRNKKPFVSYPCYSSVLELATNNDVLILCCELNDKTRHIVNREVMLALGKEGFIVNVGRGALIDEKELLHCLTEGEIAGAGLDVFVNEPHVPKEFFSLDNVVLSPHAAMFTTESFDGISELMERNLEAFFSNEPLITPVILD